MDKNCPNCGQSIPEESSFCLHCFTIINKKTDETLVATNKKTDKNKKIIIIAILIILASVLPVASIIFANNVKDKEPETVTPSVTTNNTITTEQQTKKATTTKKVTTTASTTTTTQAITEMTTEKTTITTTSTTKKIDTTKSTTVSAKIIINGGTLKNYPSNRKNSSYTIPYKISKISKNAFNNNKYIKTLTFSKRETVECDWANLFSNLPNLETVYVYPGTSADIEGLQYFSGEIIYYD